MADIKIKVDLRFEDISKERSPEEVAVYVFDKNSELISQSDVKVNGDQGQTIVALPKELEGRTLQALIGPKLANDDGDNPTKVRLERYRALSRKIVAEHGFVLEALIHPDFWIHWLWCLCTVRGKVVKRVEQPDGSTKELPICNARVRVFEVDRIPILLRRLPDKLLVKMRDDLLGAIGVDPRPFPLKPGNPILGLSLRNRLQALQPTVRDLSFNLDHLKTDFHTPSLLLGEEQKVQISSLTQAIDLSDLRQQMIRLPYQIYARFFCLWDWLNPFITYSKDPVLTLEVDGSGEFAGFFAYPCLGDRPDLYFVVEQNQGGTWKTIHEPLIRCNTYWNYQCGSEVLIVVTDPCAECCEPDQPVDVPPGVGTYIMPFAVGNTKIWGAPAGGANAPRGWVRTDGLTNYGADIDNAPFGGTLGFRMIYSGSLPDAGIVHYRWSYRKVGTAGWSRMVRPVYRRYERTLPGELPTFPPYHLGPKDVGTEHDLFEFRPHNPPAPAAADPAGTTHAWPAGSFGDESYASLLDSHTLPPNAANAAGDYEVKVEAFDDAGNQVQPGAGTFQFLVPESVAADGITIDAREATAAEIQNGAFVFRLHVDNRPTTAAIDRPAIGSGAGASTTDDCGFLRYDPATADPVTIAFHAQHPANRALFDFYIRRGDNPALVGHVDNGEVGALAEAPYTGDGSGNFSEDFARVTLLTPNCPEGAFAQHLRVIAKATTGVSRISSYDSGLVTAFALAPEQP